LEALKFMKPRFTIRAILVAVLMIALLLMNVRERQLHHEELAALKRELQIARDGLATHGLSALFQPFEPDETRIVVIDLYGEGQSSVRDPSVVARRVLIETAEPAAVYTVDEAGQRTIVCETEVRDGPGATCSLTVFAHVPGSRPASSHPSLEFGLRPAGGAAHGRSLSATLAMGDDLEDHFHFDLVTGVYPRGAALDFYRIGIPRRFE
jgi:hypothetical protein